MKRQVEGTGTQFCAFIFKWSLQGYWGYYFFITFKTVLVIYVGLVNEVHGYSNF